MSGIGFKILEENNLEEQMSQLEMPVITEAEKYLMRVQHINHSSFYTFEIFSNKIFFKVCEKKKKGLV